MYEYQKGMGVIFLRHNHAGGLDLVVWGAELSGLQSAAARLIRMLTGIGQPGFTIVGNSCAWKLSMPLDTLTTPGTQQMVLSSSNS